MNRILIVDDEKNIRRTLSEFLRGAGYEAAEAEDADVALRLLSESAYDVVVSDIILPRVTGVELLRRIHEISPYVQVVMMTGEPTVETAAESLRAGAADYLFKPVGKADIVRIVGNAVRIKVLEDTRRRLEEENQAYSKKLEQMVAERTEQLRKLARAVEQSPVSIMITDCNASIEFVNPRFTAVTGYSPNDVLGRNPRILKSGETDVKEYRKLWDTLAAGQEWHGEFHNKRKDGTLYWESGVISPIFDDSGVITHFLAIREDNTEKKLLEAKLNRAQRIGTIGELASGISHDLNNVLSSILMSASLLQNSNKQVADADRNNLFRVIDNSAKRAVKFVKQLLSFGRGNDDELHSLQPRNLLHEIAQMIQEIFPRNIALKEEVSDELWLVKGNNTQLYQVLLNLCVNARDAMPHGGTITLAGNNLHIDECFCSMNPEAKPGPYVHIRVSDTGIGIPIDIQNKIFESFFTTKEQGKGTGLGLTTALGIVKNHGGILLFQSKVNVGTHFDVYLPAEIAQQSTPSATEGFPTVDKQGKGELILVVDDEPTIRYTVERVLRQNGYEVMTAVDGIEATAILVKNLGHIQILLTDIMMPKMDGVSLCRIVKKLDPNVSIVAITGLESGNQSELTALRDMGITNILLKPYGSQLLLQTLNIMLTSHQVWS